MGVPQEGQTAWEEPGPGEVEGKWAGRTPGNMANRLQRSSPGAGLCSLIRAVKCAHLKRLQTQRIFWLIPRL